MKAAIIRQFGSLNEIVIDEVPRPVAARGQLLVRAQAAGVGPWDALVREGKSATHQPLPLVLGSDVSGIVEHAGPDVTGFKDGDAVYGAANEQFTGGYAEYTLATAAMMAPKPKKLNFVEAASVPVVAVTAWQMLFEYAKAKDGQTALIHGAAGNVGAYAVQLAASAGIRVIATCGAADMEYVQGLGADRVLDYKAGPFEESVAEVDAVIDTVGGSTQQRSLSILKRGGMLVSAVSPVPEEAQQRFGVKGVFFLVNVTTERLNRLSELFEQGTLKTDVGTVLPLADARLAHEMLAGARHPRGKIVLRIAGN